MQTKRQISPEARERMRQGGKNRAKAFTSEYQSQTRSQLPHEVCVKGGKRAYQKLIENFGREYAEDKAADWRRAKGGSSLEKIVAQWLPADAEQEAKIKNGDEWFYVDFLIGKIAIEVNGAYAHSQREDRDAYKYRTLADWGYTVVVLPEQDIKSGAAQELVNRIFKEC